MISDAHVCQAYGFTQYPHRQKPKFVCPGGGRPDRPGTVKSNFVWPASGTFSIWRVGGKIKFFYYFNVEKSEVKIFFSNTHCYEGLQGKDEKTTRRAHHARLDLSEFEVELLHVQGGTLRF